MRLRLVVVLVVIAAMGAACIDISMNDAQTIEGSGQLVTESYDFTGFDQVQLSHSFHATIDGSDVFSIDVTFDDNLRDVLVVERRGSTLVIGLESGTSTRNVTLEATITMPALTALNLSGASEVAISGLDPMTDLTLDASGASTIEGDIDATKLDAELSGASTLDLAGYVTEARLDASGASHLPLAKLEIERAEVQLSGASTADLYVSQELGPVDVSGASRLRYDGSPSLHDVSSSGASTINGE